MKTKQSRRIELLEEALGRAIQHIPPNAVCMKAALTKPVSQCRTLDFCQRVLKGEIT